MYDAQGAEHLEATVAQEKSQVQQCKERVDDLASHLAGASSNAALLLKSNARQCSDRNLISRPEHADWQARNEVVT